MKCGQSVSVVLLHTCGGIGPDPKNQSLYSREVSSPGWLRVHSTPQTSSGLWRTAWPSDLQDYKTEAALQHFIPSQEASSIFVSPAVALVFWLEPFLPHGSDTVKRSSYRLYVLLSPTVVFTCSVVFYCLLLQHLSPVLSLYDLALWKSAVLNKLYCHHYRYRAYWMRWFTWGCPHPTCRANSVYCLRLRTLLFTI